MREKIWLWGHKEGMQNNRWGLFEISKITPFDACEYMGIENLIFVREFGLPGPEEYERYANSFKNLKKIVWSIVGADATFEQEDVERIIVLKKKFKNIIGGIADDFFVKEVPAIDLGKLSKIKEKMKENKLELWAVIYQHQLNLSVEKYIEKFDLMTYWIWRSEEINEIEENFNKFCDKHPEKRKMLGCYMWDYGNGKPMPLALMQKQCSLGLQWLGEKKIEGIIFLASCICDLKLESVEGTREWITSL